MSSAELVSILHEVITPENDAQFTWRYDCEVGPQHVDPALLPPSGSKFIKEHFEIGDGQSQTYLGWRSIPSYEFGKDAVDLIHNMATWIKNTIREIPGGTEITRGVDGGGYTHAHVSPKMFTRWAPLDTGTTYARFSESRSAMHNSMMTTKGYIGRALLRSPVENGVVLEVTNKPDSLDPRDAVSLMVYAFGSGAILLKDSYMARILSLEHYMT